MTDRIESFPGGESERNLNRLKFLSQNFYRWFQDIPDNYRNIQLRNEVMSIFSEIHALSQKPANGNEAEINGIELRIQSLMNVYKLQVGAENKIQEVDKYNIYGNEIYGISYDIIGALNYVSFIRSLESERKDKKIVDEARNLLNFLEEHFGSIEDNKPIKKDIDYSKKILQAIKLLLGSKYKDQIFTPKQIQKLEEYWKSQQ